MPVTATEGTNEPRQPDKNASKVCVRSHLERDARCHPRMRSHDWLRRLPTRWVCRYDRACLLRRAARVLVWQSVELSGRWSLEPLRQGASGALPASHARSTGAPQLRAVPRASRRGRTRPSTLNEDHAFWQSRRVAPELPFANWLDTVHGLGEEDLLLGLRRQHSPGYQATSTALT